MDNPRAIEFFHIESLTHPNYPIFIEARTPEIREAWLSGIGEYVVDTGGFREGRLCGTTNSEAGPRDSLQILADKTLRVIWGEGELGLKVKSRFMVNNDNLG